MFTIRVRHMIAALQADKAAILDAEVESHEQWVADSVALLDRVIAHYSDASVYDPDDQLIGFE